MKSLIKRILLLFSIIMLTTILSFSQNISKEINQDSTVLITTSQLKYANFIFAEHSKLLANEPLLISKINLLQNKNEHMMQVDSIKTKQINYQKEMLSQKEQTIQDLNISVSNKNSTIKKWKIGCFTVSAALIIALFVIK